jgi:hypothetical protein
MKVIVAGGRDFKDKATLRAELNSLCKDVSREDMEIVCGMAKGADLLGYEVANDVGVKVVEFPANWGEHGKSAGPIRNKEMADYGDTLLAFWDGRSRGTKNMIDTATKQGLLVKVVYY